jgi:hypothetical protein
MKEEEGNEGVGAWLREGKRNLLADMLDEIVRFVQEELEHAAG